MSVVEVGGFAEVAEADFVAVDAVESCEGEDGGFPTREVEGLVGESGRRGWEGELDVPCFSVLSADAREVGFCHHSSVQKLHDVKRSPDYAIVFA